MSNHFTGALAARAGLLALLMSGAAGAAFAQDNAPPPTGADPREARIEQLEAEVQQLADEVQDLKRGQAEQIQTLPGAIESAVAANKPKPGWADGTRIGGQVFANISDIHQTPTPNKINGFGVDIKRAYLTVDHKFNDIYSANVTLDFAPNGIILSGGTYGAGTLQGSEVVKYAYLQARYDDALIVQVGAEKTPWIPFVDDVAGYRYIDKHIVDQNKYGNSSDWGVNASGSLWKGLVNYSVMGSDGAGYKNPVRSRTMDFEGRISVNYQGFVGAIGGYYGDISNSIEGGAPNQNVSRFDALLAYSNKQFRLGGEFFQAWDYKTSTGSAAVAAVAPTFVTGPCTVNSVVTTCTVETSPGSAAVASIPPKQDRAQGYAFWGSYNLTPQWSIFARYDGLNPSQILDPKEHYDYVNAGVQYEPLPNLDLALVYKHEDVSHAIKGGYGDATTTLAPGSTLTYNTTTHKYTPGSGSSSASFDEVGVYTNFKF